MEVEILHQWDYRLLIFNRKSKHINIIFLKHTENNAFFTDRSKVVLLLWILFVIYISCLSCFLVCSLQPCGHLLGKGWPLGSLVCDIFLCFSLFLKWCPGSGVVLDCIDSWSLPSSLLIKCSKLIFSNEFYRWSKLYNCEWGQISAFCPLCGCHFNKVLNWRIGASI